MLSGAGRYMAKDKFRRMNEGQWEPAFSGVMAGREALSMAVAAEKGPGASQERTADDEADFHAANVGEETLCTDL